MKTIKFISSLTALTAIPLGVAIQLHSKQDTQIVGAKEDQLLYQYNGKIYQDTNNILRDFLLQNPQLIQDFTVLGDVEKATIDYDYEMVNKGLLPDYDASKINPVFEKPSGELTADFEDAQKAQINPAFTRTRITDGFGNFFSVSDQEKAKKSFKNKLLTGTMGVFDFDALNSYMTSFNPLSEEDFQQVKYEAESALKNAPYKMASDNYTHQWYFEGKPLESLDDIFKGSEAQLSSLINESLQNYNEMQNIYSDLNGFDTNQDLARKPENVKGINIKGVNPTAQTTFTDKENFNWDNLEGVDLVYSDQGNELKTIRQDLEIQRQELVTAQENLEIQKNKEDWSETQKTTLNKEATFTKKVNHTLNYPNYYWTKNEGSRRYYRVEFFYQWGNETPKPFFNYYFTQIRDQIYYPKEDFWNAFSSIEDSFSPLTSSSKKFSISLKSSYYLIYNSYGYGEWKPYDSKDFYSIDFSNDLRDLPSDVFDLEYKVNVNDIEFKQKLWKWSTTWQSENIFPKIDFDIEYRYKCQSENKNVYIEGKKVYLTQEELNYLSSFSGMDVNKTSTPAYLKKFLDTLFNEQPILRYSENSYRWHPIKRLTTYQLDNFKIYAKENNFYMKVEIIAKNKKGTVQKGQTKIEYQYQNNFLEIPIAIVPDYEKEISDLETREKKLSDIEFNNIFETKNGFHLEDYNNLFDPNTINRTASQHFYLTHQIIISYEEWMKMNELFYSFNNSQDLYLLAKSNGIIEPFWIDLKQLNNSFVSLMSGNDVKDKFNLWLKIDFGEKIKENLNFDNRELSNINFKWILEKEHVEYADTDASVPVSLDIKKINNSSFKEDNLFNNLMRVKKDIEDELLPTTNHPIYQWIRELNLTVYQESFSEYLNFNNKPLWKINRDSFLKEVNNISFASPEQGDYTLEKFFKVIKTSNNNQKQMVAEIIRAVETNHYEDFKNLLKEVDLISLADLKEANDSFLTIAYNYLATLKAFINVSSATGNLPQGKNYQFPNLDHIFIHDQEINVINYIINNEFIFNGTLTKTTGGSKISKVYDLQAGIAELNQDRQVIIDKFIPNQVVQIFDAIGNPYNNGQNYGGDEEVAIINAQNEALPKVNENYISYQGYPELVLYKISLIYELSLPNSEIKIYFRSFESLKIYLLDYLLTNQLIKTMTNQGGNNG